MTRSKIIAVDFDGTLISEGCFPGTGPPNQHVLNYCKSEQERGAKIILWTNREGEPLQTAVRWCHDHDLYLDAVNDNVPESIAFLGYNSRKIYADEFIDDRMRGNFQLSYRKIKPLTMNELVKAYQEIYLNPYYHAYELGDDPIYDVRPHPAIEHAIIVQHHSGFERTFYVLEN